MLGQARSTQRHEPIERSVDAALTKRVIELASQCGRYGYRRVTALLSSEGWLVNHKRVERNVPQKQPKRSRLWLNDGSCVRSRGASEPRLVV